MALHRVPKKMIGIAIFRGNVLPTMPPTRKLDSTSTQPQRTKQLFQKPRRWDNGTFDRAASPTAAALDPVSISVTWFSDPV